MHVTPGPPAESGALKMMGGDVDGEVAPARTRADPSSGPVGHYDVRRSTWRPT
jgi:hypothetical protein